MHFCRHATKLSKNELQLNKIKLRIKLQLKLLNFVTENCNQRFLKKKSTRCIATFNNNRNASKNWQIYSSVSVASGRVIVQEQCTELSINLKLNKHSWITANNTYKLCMKQRDKTHENTLMKLTHKYSKTHYANCTNLTQNSSLKTEMSV